MLPGEVGHLRHLGLRHLIRINTANSDAFVMNVQHYPRRVFPPLVEEAFENMNDELHGGVVVIQKHYLVKAWLFCFRSCLGDETCTAITFIVTIVITG